MRLRPAEQRALSQALCFDDFEPAIQMDSNGKNVDSTSSAKSFKKNYLTTEPFQDDIL